MRNQGAAVNFTPGPVSVSEAVQRAFASPPISHRAPEFVAALQDLRRRLAALVRCRDVAVMLGSGTLANEAVAARLAACGEPGVIACNGEFGERLCRQALRWNLRCEVVTAPWGEELDRPAIERALRRGARWLWAVHCETSTGVLNDLDQLRTLCRAHDGRLYLDAVSSVGAVPVDLNGVCLASGVSGKALRGYPGLALVFSECHLQPEPSVPLYLDIGLYSLDDGIPFTHSSNLVLALAAALRPLHQDAAGVFARVKAHGSALRRGLEAAGFSILARESIATPAVVTIPLPPPIDSVAVGEHMERQGWLLSYRSSYLVRRNWLQICLMGHTSPELLADLPGRLRAACTATPSPPTPRSTQSPAPSTTS